MKPLLSLLAWFLLATATYARATAPVVDLGPARLLYDEGEYSDAGRSFRKLELADPMNAEVHYYLGQIALQRDDTEIAIRELEKSVAIAPYIARGHNALGDAYGRAAQKAGIFSQFNLARKSRSEYERAVELEPDNVDFHTSLFEYFLQAPSFVGGGFDHATTEADAIKQLDAKSGHQAYARLYEAQAKYDQALTELNAVLKTDPNDYATLYQLGRTAAVSGQHFEEGLASLRHCLQLAAPTGSPDHAAVQWRIGNILEKKGDSAGAREAYESALKMDPKFAPATESLAKLKSADVSRKL